MKGKKTDSIFLSNFIEKCVMKGISSKEEILYSALQEIEEIDFKIKEVEQLKIIRSKLLDVVETFDISEKDNSSEKKILNFINITDAKISKIICDILRVASVPIKNIKELSSYDEDMIFCLKQLQENHIISRIGDSFVRGTMFEQYYDFLLT